MNVNDARFFLSLLYVCTLFEFYSALLSETGKHPVSALIELCNKRRIMQPDFVMVHHSGPDHRKNFLFKVSHFDSVGLTHFSLVSLMLDL